MLGLITIGTTTHNIYTLSLHDALPISEWCLSDRAIPVFRTASPETCCSRLRRQSGSMCSRMNGTRHNGDEMSRSEEHTSELQSHSDIVCRLLLEKKKNYIT